MGRFVAMRRQTTKLRGHTPSTAYGRFLQTSLPVSLSQEYVTPNKVQRSVVGTGLWPANTKFQVGVAGTTCRLRLCSNVKVRVTLDQCIRIFRRMKPGASSLHGRATLFLSLLLQ